MNRNLNRRIHPIAEADGLSPKKLVKDAILSATLLNGALNINRLEVSARNQVGLI